MAAQGQFMDPAIDNVAVSGAILANIFQDFHASRGDCDGVLFGHLQRTISSKLEDDDERSGVHEEITAIITGFFCSGSSCSFYNNFGRIIPSRLAKYAAKRGSRGGDPIIGWFSGRHNTPMVPSLREAAVTRSLRLSGLYNSKESSLAGNEGGFAASQRIGSSSAPEECSPTHVSIASVSSKLYGNNTPLIDLDSSVPNAPVDTLPKLLAGQQVNMDSTSLLGTLSNSGKDKGVPQIGVPPSSPCLLMLLTESGAHQAVHDHEYRLYQYHITSEKFEPKSVKIVNIGPAFRVQYNTFLPVAPFPHFFATKSKESASNSSSSSSKTPRRDLSQGSRTLSSLEREQALLDAYSEGYNVNRLANLAGPDGLRLVPELEDLYLGMLKKLEVLAKNVSETASALAQQENANRQSRLKGNFSQ
ncbi:hypothetical protein KP509_02G050800 [Ceratopteris richardii]|uniref:Uncharacterized protein n=1 Tax=Ceratopteris richardii TaxID=49495 RepID=A0A8T2V9M7_CERRI|nr:hypothetical protein KP509_02G050800 [Ceratopteris richardii]